MPEARIPALPYEGYTWTFTQHDIAISSGNLYKLLACAELFDGRAVVSEEINEEINKLGLLTPNMRDGRSDAWRDYQQVLAELGLMYSTKLQRKIKITPAGKMFLAGEIGFSELMTTQAMRYQYPNGYKHAPSTELRAAGANNLIDLQLSSGVTVKPATLIANVLIGLEEAGAEAHLTIDECLAFVLPAKTNQEWPVCLQAIIESRASGGPGRPHRHARRNMQDWYKFLSKTDFFDLRASTIQLSDYGKHALPQLKEFCDSQSRETAFWQPRDSSPESRKTWFYYFGQIPMGLEVVRTQDEIDSAYEDANYFGGVDTLAEDLEEAGHASGRELALKRIPVRRQRIPILGVEAEFDAEQAVKNLKSGILRRRMKTQTHDQIVLALAAHLRQQGAETLEDPDSVDILAVWPDGSETMFEVKTVTRRSFQHRMRLAIGQLEEYAYRRDDRGSCDKVIVINADMPEESWYQNFLGKKMNISVIVSKEEGYTVHSASNTQTRQNWGM